MNKLTLLAFALIAASLATAQDGSADHGKIMGCYFGSWAFYRCPRKYLYIMLD